MSSDVGGYRCLLFFETAIFNLIDLSVELEVSDYLCALFLFLLPVSTIFISSCCCHFSCQGN